MPELDLHVNDSVQGFSCSVSDVIHTILKLKSHPSPGPDNITVYFLKKVKAHIDLPLTRLFN